MSDYYEIGGDSMTVTTEVLATQLGIDTQVVFEFFVVFSRFEYALKRTGYLKTPDGLAEASWDKFADELEGQFATLSTPEFKHSQRFLCDHPPKRQWVEARVLRWQETPRNGKSDEKYTLRLVRNVRNNLFHGGKYPTPDGPVSEPGRDRDLLRACVEILRACLSLNAELERVYSDMS